jgi:regulatory protein
VNRPQPLSRIQKARQYAFYLLKFRMRSEREIASRMEKKDFDPATIRQVISFLKEKGFLDDESFARAWIESRIKKPLGLRRLRDELRLKGVEDEIIARQLERIKKDYSEKTVVLEVARNRLSKLKGIEEERAKRRVFAYLLRHGFSPEIVIETINSL